MVLLAHRQIGSIGPAVFTLAMVDPKLAVSRSIFTEDFELFYVSDRSEMCSLLIVFFLLERVFSYLVQAFLPSLLPSKRLCKVLGAGSNCGIGFCAQLNFGKNDFIFSLKILPFFI